MTFNKINSDFKLMYGFRNLEENDLVEYSKKTNWLTRTIFSLKLFITGKGYLDTYAYNNLIENQKKSLEEFNKSKSILKKDISERNISQGNGQVKGINLSSLVETTKEKDAETRSLAVQNPSIKDNTKDPFADYSFQQLWQELQNQSEVIGNKNTEETPNILGNGISSQNYMCAVVPKGEQDQEAFWESIFNHSDIIIDLVPLDRFIISPRLEPYFPVNQGQTKKCGLISIKLIKNESILKNDQSYQAYTYELTNQTSGETKRVKRFCANWISPKELAELMRTDHLKTETIPFICGYKGEKEINRAPLFIATAILKEKIDSNEINEGNFKSSLIKLVVDLRKQSGTTILSQQQFYSLCLQARDMLMLQKK